eukprot:6205806-Pleurochrysis_carterae.AAC.2
MRACLFGRCEVLVDQVEHVVGGVGVGREGLAELGEVGGQARRRAQVGGLAAREEEHLSGKGVQAACSCVRSQVALGVPTIPEDLRVCKRISTIDTKKSPEYIVY